MTPPTHIKKYKKWKKEQYQLIEYEIKDKEELIEKMSPFYDCKTGSKTGLSALSIYNEDSESFNALKGGIKSGIDINATLLKQHKKVWEELRSLIVFDKGISEYEVNDEKARNARDEAIISICTLLYELTAEAKYYFLKNLCDYGELSALTETRICWHCYYENNDMRSDFTYKIGQILIKRVDTDVIGDILEWEIEQAKKGDDISIRNEMSVKDAVQMQEYIDKGEMFYAYRGFLVEQDEYVRAGKKADGEAYFEWNAGKGLSFTFNESTAYYFCYWQMLFQELGGKFKSDDNLLKNIPNTIKTKEEWIGEQAGRISQLIDRVGKKPIVGRFLIEPTSLAMANNTKNEAEINLAPEKALLVDYNIASSERIAREMWNKNYAGWVETADMFAGIDNSKVTMLNTFDEKGNKKAMFAEVKAVKDDINKCKEEYLATGDLRNFQQKINRIFIENAVEIPSDINIRNEPTKRFWDFITNNEERLVRKRAQQYILSTSQ